MASVQLQSVVTTAAANSDPACISSVLAHAILFVGLHERIPRTIVARHATENSLARYSSPGTGSKLSFCQWQTNVVIPSNEDAVLTKIDHSSTEFEMLVNSVREYAIYMIDVNGHVMSWNSGAARIKGYTGEEILGQHFSIFHTEADRQNGIPMLALQQAAKDGKFEAEGWRRRKDGTEFWASVVV